MVNKMSVVKIILVIFLAGTCTLQTMDCSIGSVL
jgi:hypothetical protein